MKKREIHKKKTFFFKITVFEDKNKNCEGKVKKRLGEKIKEFQSHFMPRDKRREKSCSLVSNFR